MRTSLEHRVMLDGVLRHLPPAGEGAGEAIYVRSGGTALLGQKKGAYLLVVHLACFVEVVLPKSGKQTLEPGPYFYAGSANGGGGIGKRLERHFKTDKKPHWHIDRLTLKAAQIGAFAIPGGKECTIAETMRRTGCFQNALVGFGSSDCKQCDSHLLRLTKAPFQKTPTLEEC